MGGKYCRLYDEHLLKNIMLSTGLSVLEYIRENDGELDNDDICEFIETNAAAIIDDTIEHLNTTEEFDEDEFDEEEEE